MNKLIRPTSWSFTAPALISASSSRGLLRSGLSLAALLLLALFAFSTTSTQGAVVNATFNAATDIPITAASYSGVGNTLNITLNFTPLPGTNLTVVRNTGLPFIAAPFTNVANGSTVNLTYNGNTYPFVAWYYGGAGRDLVLFWPVTNVATWGDNSSGELGNGSSGTDQYAPVAVDQTGVLAGKTIVQLSHGTFFTLVLTSDGAVFAWGANGSGSLGNNGVGTQQNSPVQVDMTGASALSGKTVVAIAAGGEQCLALCSDGTLAAWGGNTNGELGNNGVGTQQNTPVAVDVTGGSALFNKTVVAIAAGEHHSMALCSDGTIAAWGYNQFGQLGNNDPSGTQQNAPVAVDMTGSSALSGKSVAAIGAGIFNSVALCSDGTLTAWGAGGYGALGNNDPAGTQQNAPVLVDTTGASALAGETVVAIAVAREHCLALCLDHTVVSWGSNEHGQLGNNDSVNQTTQIVPVLVDTTGASALSGKTVVAIGTDHLTSLALCSDGTIAAWGYNVDGELGNGDSSGTNQFAPVAVSTASGTSVLSNSAVSALSMGTGPYHSAAIYTSLVLAITPNAANLPMNSEQIVIEGAGFSPTPADDIVTFGDGAVGSVIAASATQLTVLFSSPPSALGELDATVSVTGVGSTGRAQVATIVATAPTNVTITGPTTQPITVASFDATGGALNIALNFAPYPGQNLTVIHNTGTSFIIGEFSNAPNGATIYLSYNGISYPFVVWYYGNGGRDLVLLWPTTNLAAWGDDSDNGTPTTPNGDLGNNDATGAPQFAPIAVDQAGVLAGQTIVQVARGDRHTLALTSAGRVYAWGENTSGQLGDRTTTTRFVPVAVNTASGVSALFGKVVVAIAAGQAHSLALCSDGTVAAWGDNSFGELGNNSSVTQQDAPVAVNTTSGVSALFGNSVVAIAAGGHHSLALCSNGTVAAWGYNSDYNGNPCGQLGNGDTTGASKLAPVAVSTAGASALSGETVVAIAVGDFHSLALCADGTLAAWGLNVNGQLGNNDATGVSQLAPVAVNTANGVSSLFGKTVIAIAGGINHSLALCADGTVSSWGQNSYGELGIGNLSIPQVIAPTAVSTASGVSVLFGKTVTAIAAGSFHCLALCADGTLASWGYNSYGQLGNDDLTGAAQPAPVAVDTTGSGNALDGAVVSSLSGACLGYHSVVIASPTGSTLASLGLSAGSLSPSFDVGVTYYTAAVLYSTTAVTVTPALTDGAATVTVNGSVVVSGQASGSIPLIVGANTITMVVTGPAGNTETYTVIFTRAAPTNNASLSGLSLSAGTLTPSFAAGRYTYGMTVSNGTARVAVTPTAADSAATITVNGVAVASGSASGAISLSFGDNPIIIVLIAQDGVTTITYTVTVHRISGDANLSSLSVIGGPLSPTFTSAHTVYTVTVPYTTAITTVSATTESAFATVTGGIGNQPLTTAIQGNQLDLLVTAENGNTQAYTITVYRTPPSTDASLSGLSFSAGTLPFATDTSTYNLTVSNAISSVTVTPTATYSAATITVNGIAVASGSASGAISLIIGNNPINIVVTAQDGMTTNTYTVNVTPLSITPSTAIVAQNNRYFTIQGTGFSSTPTGNIVTLSDNAAGNVGAATATQIPITFNSSNLPSAPGPLYATVTVPGVGSCGPTQVGTVVCPLYVSQLGGGVAEYDLVSGELIGGNSMITKPIGIALSAAGDYFYVADDDGVNVGEYQAATGAESTPTYITQLNHPVALAISGNNLYVASANTVGKYDGSTSDAHFISKLSGPQALAIFENILLVANENGTVGAYNATTGAVIKADFITGLSNPAGLAVSGNTLYVANANSETVGTYNASTGAKINAEFITGLVQPAALTVWNNILFVGSQSKGTVGEYNASTGVVINPSFITAASGVGGLAAFVPPGLSQTLGSPVAKAKLAANSITLSGEVIDYAGVGYVEVSLNGGPSQMIRPAEATGDFQWSWSTVPAQGVNTVLVIAYDAQGNASPPVSSSFTFTFIAANYHGLITAMAGGGAALFDTNGLLAVTVSRMGAFTGKATIGGVSFPLSGVFQTDGSAGFGSKLAATLPLGAGDLALNLDTTSSQVITGAVTASGHTLATIQADRALYTAQKNPMAPLQNVPVTILNPAQGNGRYTAVFQPEAALNNNPDATPFPQGNGYATLTMSGAGAVTIVGKLADGSPISYSNYLSLANHLPVFIPLYGNMGFLFGDVVFDPTQAETDASDVGMLWLKPSEPESLYYPSGWPKGISVDLLASKYVVPMKPETALGNSETPLTIALADGDLQSSTSNSASIKANGLVTVPPSTPGAGEVMGLKALFTTSTGLLTGSFTHPVTKNTVSFTGVALQKMNSAEGYFLVPPPKSASAGTFPSSGSVMITTQ